MTSVQHLSYPAVLFGHLSLDVIMTTTHGTDGLQSAVSCALALWATSMCN